MARGNLPSLTPQVPADSFVAVDMIYRHLQALDRDLRYVEGLRVLTAPAIVSNIVLASNNALTFPMLPFQKVLIKALLITTANYKFRHSGPAAPALVMLERSLSNTAGNTIVRDTAYSAADITTVTAAVVRLEGVIHNGATAGYFQLLEAQNASNVTPAGLQIGSYLSYSPVA